MDRNDSWRDGQENRGRAEEGVHTRTGQGTT